MFVHGTTVTTNALIERAGTRVAYVTNKGFRDAIFIQNANRRDLYSLVWKKPRPLAARHDCLEVDCRIDSRGAGSPRLAQRRRRARYRASASRGRQQRGDLVPLLVSQPRARARARRRLTEALPDLSISHVPRGLSALARERPGPHDDRRRLPEADVSSTTSRTSRAVSRTAGSTARLLVMKSNGGVVEAETAAERPVNYLVSGPVGGVMGGSALRSDWRDSSRS